MERSMVEKGFEELSQMNITMKHLEKCFMTQMQMIHEQSAGLEKMKREQSNKDSFFKACVEWRAQLEAFKESISQQEKELLQTVLQQTMDINIMEQISMFMKRLDQIFDETGIATFSSEAGSQVNLQKQSIAKIISTDSKELAGTVIQSKAKGYQFGGEVLLKERVVVYKYDNCSKEE